MFQIKILGFMQAHKKCVMKERKNDCHIKIYLEERTLYKAVSILINFGLLEFPEDIRSMVIDAA